MYKTNEDIAENNYVQTMRGHVCVGDGKGKGIWSPFRQGPQFYFVYKTNEDIAENNYVQTMRGHVCV